MKIKRRIFPVLFLMLSNIGFAQTLEISIYDLRNNNGEIVLNFYTNAESFEKEEPAFVKAYPKKGINGNNFNITIENIKPDTYAIALIDDENNNEKIDKRLLVPTEGFAFSNFTFEKKRKPAFDSFSFKHKSNVTLVEFEVYYFK